MMAREGRDSMRSLSERIYAVLLAAYPKGFRREYGPWTVQAFGDQCREESGRDGALGLTRLWLRTLLDLVSSTVSERSKTMGSGLMRAGGLMTLRNLMVFNAAIVLTSGVAFAFAPVLIDLYNFTLPSADSNAPSDWAGIAFARFFGVVCVGYGLLLWTTSGAADLWARRTVSGVLLATNLFGTLVLLAQQYAIWESMMGWVTVVVHLFFTVGYGFVWLKGSPASAPTGTSPLSAADEAL